MAAIVFATSLPTSTTTRSVYALLDNGNGYEVPGFPIALTTLQEWQAYYGAHPALQGTARLLTAREQQRLEDAYARTQHPFFTLTEAELKALAAGWTLAQLRDRLIEALVLLREAVE